MFCGNKVQKQLRRQEISVSERWTRLWWLDRQHLLLEQSSGISIMDTRQTAMKKEIFWFGRLSLNLQRLYTKPAVCLKSDFILIAKESASFLGVLCVVYIYYMYKNNKQTEESIFFQKNGSKLERAPIEWSLTPSLLSRFPVKYLKSFKI